MVTRSMSALMAADDAPSRSIISDMDIDGYSSSTSSTPSVYVEIIRRPRRINISELVQEELVPPEPSQAPSNTATLLLLDTRIDTELILQMPLNNHNLPQQVVQQASSSPVKVHGTIINVSGDFGRVARQGGIVLDKSLLCKALFDTPAPIRVCLPRRFGKTFNLSVIEEFFNVVTCKDAKLVDGNVDKAAGCANRMELFKDSLLRGEHPEFFEEHFCKTPVIRINMKDTRVSSVGGFYKALTKSVCRIAEIWHSDAKKVEWDTSAKRAWSNLEAAIDEVDLAHKQPGGWESNGEIALYLYEALEKAVASAYSTKCIVLLDEYDIPLDNPNTLTGVLVGVHEIELDDLRSGPNNIVTLALTVPKHTETLNANAMGIVSYNKFGELFAFTQAEVEALVEKFRRTHTLKCTRSS
ncbi:hypothetical protein IW145_003746 [Coemansia sp. RSA 521]|nr:hypothetical protein IW145_003746 [Coemansia sp. RSA 521]